MLTYDVVPKITRRMIVWIVRMLGAFTSGLQLSFAQAPRSPRVLASTLIDTIATISQYSQSCCYMFNSFLDVRVSLYFIVFVSNTKFCKCTLPKSKCSFHYYYCGYMPHKMKGI